MSVNEFAEVLMSLPRSRPKTDGEVVAIARRMQTHLHIMWGLLEEIEVSGHPNADAMARDLRDQCVPFAWPEHVISGHLSQPQSWETGDFGIRHKAATKASEVRVNREGTS